MISFVLLALAVIYWASFRFTSEFCVRLETSVPAFAAGLKGGGRMMLLELVGRLLQVRGVCPPLKGGPQLWLLVRSAYAALGALMPDPES